MSDPLADFYRREIAAVLKRQPDATEKELRFALKDVPRSGGYYDALLWHRDVETALTNRYIARAHGCDGKTPAVIVRAGPGHSPQVFVRCPWCSGHIPGGCSACCRCHNELRRAEKDHELKELLDEIYRWPELAPVACDWLQDHDVQAVRLACLPPARNRARGKAYIKFRGGPAVSHVSADRLPCLLRVVQNPLGRVFALDGLEDVPHPLERVAVYGRGNVRQDGPGELKAVYRYHVNQPDEAVSRDNARWREWARAESKEHEWSKIETATPLDLSGLAAVFQG